MTLTEKGGNEMNGMNSGYQGWRMSKRAVGAYEDGEMPKSKWTKTAILDRIDDLIYQSKIKVNFDFKKLEKLNKQELADLLLSYSSYHHTSLYCNTTDFYEVDQDAIEKLTNENVDEIIANRKPKTRQAKIEAPNLYITALAEWSEWEGTRNHPKKVEYKGVIFYRSADKMIMTTTGNKRLSSLRILKKVEQKTKYAKKEKVQY